MPSQEYTLDLVREAIARTAVIVRMRTCRGFLERLPELGRYERHYRVQNFQTPVISPRNCLGFEDVVRAIRDCQT